MRLNDPDTVDYLGLEKETGCVVVTLVDDCGWEDEMQHLGLLQAKVNRYFDFIESGEVYQQLAETTGRKVGSASTAVANKVWLSHGRDGGSDVSIS